MNPVYRRAISLMEAEIGDELVALDADAGVCFGFNGVATFVWRSLERPKHFDELHSMLMDEYDVSSGQCAEDLGQLLDDLQSKGLVAQSPADGNKSR